MNSIVFLPFYLNILFYYKYYLIISILSLDLPVNNKYSNVLLSTGKKPIVAPYSGDILESVALSGNERDSSPSPKNSTNLPTTPTYLNILVNFNTTSVAQHPSGSVPVTSTPTTSGNTIETNSPNITASASIPPTPHPKIPNAFIIVVCESVPTNESGYKVSEPNTTLASDSKLT